MRLLCVGALVAGGALSSSPRGPSSSTTPSCPAPSTRARRWRASRPWRRAARGAGPRDLRSSRRRASARAAEADAVLARGAAFSKARAAYRKPPKRGVLDRAAAALEVLHEDDRVIAVAKPNGVLSMAAGTTKRFATLPDAVALAAGVALSDLGGPNALGVVHRLDRDAPGAMVLAKTRAAHALLVREFAARRVRKTYLAVGRGAATWDGARAVDDDVQGKPAATEVAALAGGDRAAGLQSEDRQETPGPPPLRGARPPARRRPAPGEEARDPGIMLHGAAFAVDAFDLDVACAPPAWWRDAAPGLRDALEAAVR
ncbi:pseudouridine synthase [Aureococcus anophagefferens]|nr:pseudouridine synthase [Aureococcus anophagefferens]